MAILALISKAVFDELPVWLGGLAALDRYTSKNPAFDKPEARDAMFLVTVKNGQLWLVAIIDQPTRKGGALVGTANTTPVTDITAQLGKLKLADGKGIKVPIGKLAMSLQTPRLLSAEDAELLRRVAPKGSAKAKAKAAATPMQMKVPKKKSSVADALPKLNGGKLSARAKALVEQVYKAPHDRALRQVAADQLLEDQHVWGEFISLQMTDPKRHAERIKQIIHHHGGEFAGAITGVATRNGLEFVDGFLRAVTTDKNKSFVTATARDKAARAKEWATVEEATFSYEVTGSFRESVFRNPAAVNLVAIYDDGYPRTTLLLSRATSTDPWQIKHWDCASELAALPDAEFARLVVPTSGRAKETYDKILAKRSKPKSKKKKKR